MQNQAISTVKAMRLTGISAFALAALTLLVSVTAYIPLDPEFSIFNTYLSDIGDTQGWPQIFFNSGTLLAAPLRYAVILLLVFRLRSFSGENKLFEVAVLTIGAISTIGTVVMTAVPFGVNLTVHKIGIGLYFLGVVILQSIIGVRELSIQELPKSLPIWSIAIVFTYLLFFILIVLYEMGSVGRNTPIFWEWMCFFVSMGWLMSHSIALGRETDHPLQQF
jgi:hypothetical membrane protein